MGCGRVRLVWLAVVCGLASSVAVLPSGGLVRGADEDAKPIKALLIIGGCYHEYDKQKDVLTKGVSARANVQWKISYDPKTTCDHLNPAYEKADWYKGFDVIVHDECSADVKDLDVIDRILEPHRKGLPAVIL